MDLWSLDSPDSGRSRKYAARIANFGETWQQSIRPTLTDLWAPRGVHDAGVLPGIRVGRRWIFTRHSYEQWECTGGIQLRTGLHARPEVRVELNARPQTHVSNTEGSLVLRIQLVRGHTGFSAIV